MLVPSYIYVFSVDCANGLKAHIRTYAFLLEKKIYEMRILYQFNIEHEKMFECNFVAVDYHY